MDIFKKASMDIYEDCYDCDYCTCFYKKKRKYNRKQGKICKHRKQSLKSCSMKKRVRQKLKKDLRKTTDML